MVKEFEKSLLHEIEEIETASIEQEILLTQYILVIDGLFQNIYPLAEINHNSKWCSLHK